MHAQVLNLKKSALTAECVPSSLDSKTGHYISTLT